MFEIPQRLEQFIPRSAAHTVAAERLDLGDKVAKRLRIDAGVLLVINDQLQRERLHGERGHEVFEKSGFSRPEKSDNKNEWSHLKECGSPEQRGGYFFAWLRVSWAAKAMRKPMLVPRPLGSFALRADDMSPLP